MKVAGITTQESKKKEIEMNGGKFRMEKRKYFTKLNYEFLL